jgi:hypothetical protein
MRRFLLGLSFVAAVPLAMLACGSETSSSSNATNEDGGGGGGGEGGGPIGDGGLGADGASDGDDTDHLPGDPAGSGSGSVQVTINGKPRIFEGPATWTKFPTDGGPIYIGFQSNATSGNNWVFVLAVFDHETSKTYACNAGIGEGGGISVHQRLPDGSSDPNGVEYGGTANTAECSILLESYSSYKDGHITGTFDAELDLSGGDSPVKHLSMTNGKFDLVQTSDVPP